MRNSPLQEKEIMIDDDKFEEISLADSTKSNNQDLNYQDKYIDRRPFRK